MRGKIIKGEASKADAMGVQTPATDSGELEDDGLGGCKSKSAAVFRALLTLYQTASLMLACCYRL